jgi:hypothetical protein
MDIRTINSYEFITNQNYTENFTHKYFSKDSRRTRTVMRNPDRPGQLFYKDGFKLEPGVELCLHRDVFRDSGLIKVQFVQFITMQQHERNWKLGAVDEEGNPVSMYCIGYAMSPYAEATKKYWDPYNWITLKSSVDHSKLTLLTIDEKEGHYEENLNAN